MKKFFICITLALVGMVTSCVDKDVEVDADSRPTWLGGSILEELRNPGKHGLLTGTFDTYLKLIDDLGYAEVLNKTGSKTVFPANDEAFARFFQNNDWGVSSYNQLSDAQKKLLLYSSMLDNALLLEMLPNVYNGTNEPLKGQAIRHESTVSTIDSIQWIAGREQMPKNNVYWQPYYDKGIHVVSDNTTQMMLHLTREFMTNNDITVMGDNSDFAILTGTPYPENAKTAYIFNDRVIKGDLTCQNGYIHQMEDVIVPPGNMAQVLKKHDNTRYFSHILDYFAVPYFDAVTTQQYNDWAVTNGRSTIDSIYQVRYLSSRSQGGEALVRDPNRQTLSTSQVLGYDPGWNEYHPAVARAGNLDIRIMDVGAFFVPDDKAVSNYFLPGGAGAYLIDIYGNRPNTAENLIENLDSLQSKNPQVLTAFTRNLMKASFSATVPSKFSTILNDASENMGLTLDMVNRKEDGKYDISFANNGAIYVINELVAPDEYQAVMAPASVYPDLRVMNWAVQDGVANGDYLGVDFKYYLLAMSANYAFFIPEDAAFDLYYLDPASLAHRENNQATGRLQPDLLHFYYDKAATNQPFLKCDRYYYNMQTGQVEGEARQANISEVKTQLVDILNYHTLVLNEGDLIGSNHYYKTKHGGEVFVDGNFVGGRVMGGLQLEQPNLFPAPQIKQIYNEKNGNAYRLSRVVQPPTKSVYAVLSENSQFSEFLEACSGFGATQILAWAGISDEVNPATGSSQQDAYTIFTRNYKMGSTSISEACLDYNVKMFNTYNYTLFAPDNSAMQRAYAQGLPKWADIQALFEKYADLDDNHAVTAQEESDKALAYVKIKALRDFVRYHFVTNSVYADNTIEGGRYTTLSADEMGVAKEVILSGGGGQLNVSDVTGHSVSVSASGSKVSNKMARDYWFNNNKMRATSIVTSSFCAVHQISEPLYGESSGRFDGAWANRASFAKSKKIYKQRKANHEL